MKIKIKVKKWGVDDVKVGDYVEYKSQVVKFLGYDYGTYPFGEDVESKEIIELPYSEDTLTIPDIRNKLTPITTMISLFEDGHFEYIEKHLPEIKKSINYLAQREVYGQTSNT